MQEAAHKINVQVSLVESKKHNLVVRTWTVSKKKG